MNLVQFSESKTLNHAFKLLTLSIFTFSLLAASGVAAHWFNVSTNASNEVMFFNTNYTISFNNVIRSQENTSVLSFNYTPANGNDAHFWVIGSNNSAFTCTNTTGGTNSVNCTNTTVVQNTDIALTMIVMMNGSTSGESTFLINSSDNNSESAAMEGSNVSMLGMQLSFGSHFINVTDNVSSVFLPNYNVNYTVNVTISITAPSGTYVTFINLSSMASGGFPQIWNVSNNASMTCINAGNGQPSNSYRVECTNNTLIGGGSVVIVTVNLSKSDQNGMFHVYTKDNYGQSAGSSMAYSNSIVFNIDNSPPTVLVTSPQNGSTLTSFYINATITESASASGVNNNSVYYRIINDTTDVNYTSWAVMNNVSLSGTGAGYNFSAYYTMNPSLTGLFNISINASDMIGNNVIQSNLTVTLLGDTTPPLVTILTPNASVERIGGLFNVTVQVQDNVSGVQTVKIKNGSGIWQAASLLTGTSNNGTWSLVIDTASAGDGNQTIIVNATDVGGNYNITENISAIFDSTPPNIALYSPVQGFNFSTSLPLTFIPTDNFAEILNCSVNLNGTVSWLEEPVLNDSMREISTNISTQGTYYWNITCYDLASNNMGNDNGNSNTSLTRAFTLDQNGPTFILSSANTTYPAGQTFAGLGQNITINVSVTDAISGVAAVYVYGYDNTTGEQVCTQGTLSLTNTSGTWLGNCTINGSSRENVSHFNMTAIDYAGNDNSMQPGVEVKVDVTEPGLSDVSSNSTTGVSRSDAVLKINASVNGAVSGIKTVNISKSGSPTKNMTMVNESMWSYTGNLSDLGCTADGPCVLITRVTDNAGNVFTDSAGFNITVDNTNSTITFIDITSEQLLPTGGCISSGQCLRNISFMVIDAGGGIDGAGISLVGDTNAGSFSQNLSCVFGVLSNCTIEWNYTGVPSGVYNLTVATLDLAGNPNSTMINFTVDADNPQMSFTVLNVSSQNQTAAGTSLRINVTLNDSFTDIGNFNVSVSYVVMNVSWLLGTGSGNGSYLYTFIPNYTGEYYVTVWANDSAGNTNGTSSQVARVFNGKPYAISTAQVTVFNDSFDQRRPRYDLMVPAYNETLGFLTGGEMRSGTYYVGGITPINATSMETLAYTYTFTLNFSATPNSIVNFNISMLGGCPANETTMTVMSPSGNKTIIMIMPDMSLIMGGSGGDFAIYWSNESDSLNLSSKGRVNATHPINGSFNQGMLTIWANATVNRTFVTLLVSPMPPINLTTQTITGFSPSSPPTMGEERLNSSYYLNLSGISEYYSAENQTVTFMFPKEANFTFPNLTNVTKIISTEVLLNRWNGSAWLLIANSSNSTFHNGSIVEAIDAVVRTNDSMPGSPTSGTNITIAMWGFRYYLAQNVSLGWKAGSNVELNATAVLNFSFSNSTVGTGAAGTAVNSNFTVMAGVQGGITIPNAYLPGFSADATISTLLLNGQPLTSDQYSKGSIVITGTALQQGANTISVTYTVPSAAITTTGTGAGGAGTAGGYQGLIFQTLTAGEPIVAQVTDRILDVRAINLTVINDATNVKITVSTLSGQPADVTAPADTVFKYFLMTPLGIDDSNVATAKVQFRVNKTWFTENNLDPATTKLNRYHNSMWEVLTTVQISSDETYYYFEAETPGFSTFAVTATEKGAPVVPTTCTTTCPAGYSQKPYPDCNCYVPQPTPSPEVTPTQPNYDWIIYLLVVAAVTMLFAFLIYERARITKKKR